MADEGEDHLLAGVVVGQVLAVVGAPWAGNLEVPGAAMALMVLVMGLGNWLFVLRLRWALLPTDVLLV